MIAPTYVYEAQEAGVNEPHDGDTFHALVRLGFRVLVDVHVRVFGVNCPELGTDGGLAARLFTLNWLTDAAKAGDWPLVLDSRSFVPDDKYGARADCVVYRKIDGRSLADDLLASGNAVRFKG